MGSKTSFDLKRNLNPAGEGGLFDAGLRFSSGKSQKARQEAQRQERQIASQRQKEDLRRSEAEDEIARKKATARGKGQGRSLLTATSPTGVQGLGG